MKYKVTYIEDGVITRLCELNSLIHAAHLFMNWSNEIGGTEQEYPNDVVRSTNGNKTIIIEQINTK